MNIHVSERLYASLAEWCRTESQKMGSARYTVKKMSHMAPISSKITTENDLTLCFTICSFYCYFILYGRKKKVYRITHTAVTHSLTYNHCTSWKNQTDGLRRLASGIISKIFYVRIILQWVTCISKTRKGPAKMFLLVVSAENRLSKKPHFQTYMRSSVQGLHWRPSGSFSVGSRSALLSSSGDEHFPISSQKRIQITKYVLVNLRLRISRLQVQGKWNRLMIQVTWEDRELFLWNRSVFTHIFQRRRRMTTSTTRASASALLNRW